MEFPFEEKPIYLNKDDLYQFTRAFGLSEPDASRIARLNQLREVSRHSKDGKLIHNYFENSNHHNIRDMAVIKMWSAYRKDRELNFVANGYDQTRRLLLWHGTRKENLFGILDDGFRRPDPKRVAHGSKFGRGIYFADRVSKSAYYCDGNGYGLLFLCEVALGAMSVESTLIKIINSFFVQVEDRPPEELQRRSARVR